MWNHLTHIVLVGVACASSGAMGYFLRGVNEEIRCEVQSAYPAEKDGPNLPEHIKSSSLADLGFAPTALPRTHQQRLWFPANGETRWHTQFADSSSLGTIQFEENSRSLNRTVSIQAEQDGSVVNFASVAVKAGMSATLALPEGNYLVQVQGYGTNTPLERPEAALLNKPMRISVRTDQRARVLLFDENGQSVTYAQSSPANVQAAPTPQAPLPSPELSQSEDLAAIVRQALREEQ